VDQATKEEVQKLLSQFQREPKSRLSRLFLKIGAGYAAMAVFTTAALLYSSFNLYLINRTARQIANSELPVITTLIKMRSSLLAQEGFTGKFAIFKDPTYIQLFQQRNREAIADLEVLDRTQPVPNASPLKVLHLEYQKAAESLFAGKEKNRERVHALALRLLTALDELYIERQGALQMVLERADRQRRSAIRWAIGISCAGFLLAILVAPFIVYRVIRALAKLQKETHRVASGDFHYQPQVPAVAEISELTSDFNEMAAKILEMEQMSQETVPLTRLPGNLAIERVLEQRLKSGTPFSFCHLELHNFEPFLAQHGYARAGKLLHKMGVLIYRAVKEVGAAEDFAGHAGGDKFVMIVSPERVALICEAVIKGADAELGKHIAPEQRETKALTTVSISVLDCDSEAYASTIVIVRAAVGGKGSLSKGPASSWDRVVYQPER